LLAPISPGVSRTVDVGRRTVRVKALGDVSCDDRGQRGRILRPVSTNMSAERMCSTTTASDGIVRNAAMLLVEQPRAEP
jgi:hypothetical protein